MKQHPTCKTLSCDKRIIEVKIVFLDTLNCYGVNEINKGNKCKRYQAMLLKSMQQLSQIKINNENTCKPVKYKIKCTRSGTNNDSQISNQHEKN